MNMKEKNKLIEKEIRKEIKNQGLSDLLDVYPVENTLKIRFLKEKLQPEMAGVFRMSFIS